MVGSARSVALTPASRTSRRRPDVPGQRMQRWVDIGRECRDRLNDLLGEAPEPQQLGAPPGNDDHRTPRPRCARRSCGSRRRPWDPRWAGVPSRAAPPPTPCRRGRRTRRASWVHRPAAPDPALRRPTSWPVRGDVVESQPGRWVPGRLEESLAKNEAAHDVGAEEGDRVLDGVDGSVRAEERRIHDAAGSRS